MVILRTIAVIVYIVVCLALVGVVLMQEGKSAGLGSIGGVADTYWGKNKGRTMEGGLVKATVALGILFIVLSVVLNLKIW